MYLSLQKASKQRVEIVWERKVQYSTSTVGRWTRRLTLDQPPPPRKRMRIWKSKIPSCRVFSYLWEWIMNELTRNFTLCLSLWKWWNRQILSGMFVFYCRVVMWCDVIRNLGVATKQKDGVSLFTTPILKVYDTALLRRDTIAYYEYDPTQRYASMIWDDTIRNGS